MRMLLSTYGSRWEEPMAGLAVKVPTPGAKVLLARRRTEWNCRAMVGAAGADRSVAMTEHAVVIAGGVRQD